LDIIGPAIEFARAAAVCNDHQLSLTNIFRMMCK